MVKRVVCDSEYQGSSPGQVKNTYFFSGHKIVGKGRKHVSPALNDGITVHIYSIYVCVYDIYMYVYVYMGVYIYNIGTISP